MKTKVKSREEKLKEDWSKYFHNLKTLNSLEKACNKYLKKIITDKIKGIKNIDIEQASRIWNEYSQKKWKLSEILHNNDIKPKIDQEEIIYELEDILKVYSKIIEQFKKEIDKFKDTQKNVKYFSSVYLENFKGFSIRDNEDNNTVKIKPITLIYGPNSYGKSSILQSLLLLNQTIKAGEDYENISLVTKGNFLNIGDFQDFINKNAEEKELKIELTLPYKSYNENSDFLEEISVGYNYSQNDLNQFVLSKIDIYKRETNVNSGKETIPEKVLKGEFTADKENPNEYELKEGSLKRKNIYKKISFLKLWDSSIDNKYYNEIFNNIEKTVKDLVYLSSYRNPPSRLYEPENNIRRYVGKNGEYTVEILNSDTKTKKSVNKWLKIIAGYELSPKNKNSINLDDKKTKINKINLLDLGSGIAQVLPVITQAFKSEGEMVLIEEPEIHLHPKAQADLGQMFAEAAQERNNTFIIETHSENLLLRIERLIRKGELSKDDVSVIYVDKDEKGSYCIPLTLDDEGDIENIDDIPDGFFEEGFNELFDIGK